MSEITMCRCDICGRNLRNPPQYHNGDMYLYVYHRYDVYTEGGTYYASPKIKFDLCSECTTKILSTIKKLQINNSDIFNELN